MIKKALHRIAHWLSWNYGTVDSKWENGKLMIGFRCNCGETSDWHESVVS